MAASWLAGLLCAEGWATNPWQGGVAVFVLALGTGAAFWGLHGEDQPPGPTDRSARGAATAAGLLLAFAAFAAGVAVGPRSVERWPTVPAGMARIEAVVEQSHPGADGRARAVLRVLSGTRLEDGAAVPAGVHLSAGPALLPSRARILTVAKLAPTAPFRNPSPHPPLPPRYAIRGRAFIPNTAAPRVLDAAFGAALLDAARARVRTALLASLPPRSAGVARALVLGEGDAVGDDDEARVRDSGLLHVFAVSGMHVVILAGLAVALLGRALLCCGPLAQRCDVGRIAAALGVPLALLYAEFAGGAPSAWRAAATSALAWSLVALGRRPDAIAVTAAAVLGLGALDPREATRPAFLLSIAATAAILDARLEPARTLREYVRAAWVLSVRTWLATAPIVLWCFGSLQIAGLFANVVMLPVGTLLLQVAAAHAVLCTLTPLGALTALPLALITDAFLEACALFARLDPGLVWPPPDVLQGALLAVAATALLVARGLRQRCALLAVTALALAACEIRLRAVERPSGKLRVLFADVGQGDGALVDLPDGRLLLIDAGGSPGGGLDPGGAVLRPLLQARRRARIDLAVLTHPHPDHYGGLRALLERFAIGELWDTGQAVAEQELAGTSREAAELIAHARRRGTRVLGPRELCGKPRKAGGARLRVLWPCPGYESTHDPNDNSLVVRLEYGRHALLFAGDAEQHAEAGLLGTGAALCADVLKVPHHGSRTSSGAEFVRAVSPRLAVISAGTGNRFGHPHPEVVQRLAQHGARVLNIADEGGVLLESDGRTLTARTWSGAEIQLGPGRSCAVAKAR